MMDYSKAQMSSFTEEGNSAGFPPPGNAGVKLEAVMEQLQRQQEAKLGMNLQEKHLLHAQLLFAQHAAAARASGSRLDPALFGKPDGQTYLAAQQAYNSRIDPDEEDEDSDEEEQEMQQYKEEQEETELLSPAGQQAFTSPNGFADWGFDESFKQRGSAIWAEESDGAKVKAEPSRDFAKLYELDNDPQRKEFLDDLFIFMQKRGTPVNRIPIMAKQVLDLEGRPGGGYQQKIWREITKGLNLPTSITSAAFTLRTQYMKYLYPFECEKKGLSSPGELQAAIDSNRREGRRPSYTNSLYRYSPSPSSAQHRLSSPTMQTTPNGLNSSASPVLKRNPDEMPTPVMPGRLPMALALGQQQQLAQAAALESFRERLERSAGGAAADGPEKKMMRMAEEQQRLMQQAIQQNLLAFASHFNPMNLKLNNGHENKQDMSLSISTNGAASISVSVEVNGTVYSGKLFAQKSAAPAASQAVNLAGTNGFSAMSSSHSPSSSSSTSSKGPN
ncbi:hypothetical protein KUCAC02_021495 [Chaenocephalus aceratus]|uniref:Uncharacterized protein n=1 Tax=Chaenocephalus aceratus TaxID=36190 RepID=A0ACB9XHE0_CHAAC|nr:hypothetical protein KUCAC02_021495 [Chaenocephalus aceratus]